MDCFVIVRFDASSLAFDESAMMNHNVWLTNMRQHSITSISSSLSSSDSGLESEFRELGGDSIEIAASLKWVIIMSHQKNSWDMEQRDNDSYVRRMSHTRKRICWLKSCKSLNIVSRWIKSIGVD